MVYMTSYHIKFVAPYLMTIARSTKSRRSRKILSDVDSNTVASHLDNYLQDPTTTQNLFSTKHEENAQQKVAWRKQIRNVEARELTVFS